MPIAVGLVTWALAVVSLAALAGFVALKVLNLRGAATVDLGWGRSIHPLGPVTLHVGAPRELVFEQVSSPYLGRTPASLRGKLEVLERGDDLVLAAHFTKVGPLTATTVETVRFTPPERLDFRHVRGPVPHVREWFILRDTPEGETEIEYGGELGFDLWFLGRLRARQTVPFWMRVVTRSLEGIKEGAEQRAAARNRRGL